MLFFLGSVLFLVVGLPLLFFVLFWYFGVIAALPQPRQSVSLFGVAFLNNRGLVVPQPITEPGLYPFLVALAVGIVLAL